MTRQLVVSYVLLVAVALAVFTVPVALTLTDQMRHDTEEVALREASAMALLLGNGDPASRQALTRMMSAYDEETPGTAEVLAPGRAGERTTVEWGESLVVTVPARSTEDGEVVGAVRIDYATDGFEERLWQIWGFRAALAIGVLVAAAVLGALAARRLTRPLRQLNAMASRIGDGDLTAHAPVAGPSETRTLARTLNSGSERLSTLVASQQKFVADASHQLRTPLTALRLSLDNIADGVRDEGVEEDVEQATAEVVRMNRLVNSLLVLARAEADIALTEPVDLGTVVAGRLDAWRAAGAESGVEFLGDPVCGGTGVHVMATPGHLEQVLDNVLSNALAVSPQGGTVTVRVRTENDTVVLEVLDEGPGMSGAEKIRAFDRFWRGRGLTGRSGSGLGLAIVKQVVADDGGSVDLRDAPGGGLCVRISLRRAATRSGG